MKKILLLVAVCFIAFSLSAQTSMLQVSGHVTDSASGNPVAFYPVHIDIDSATGGFIYHRDVFTMQNGFYVDSIFFSPSNIPSGIIRISTWDCMQHLHIAQFAFGPGNLLFTKDFVICTGPPPPPCHADFWPAFPPPPLTVQFNNISSGSNGPWQWQFGDGSASTFRDPLHSYAAPGTYHVTLTMGDSLGGGCFDSETKEIHVGDSNAGGCHAEFTWIVDSMASTNVIHFIDLSVGGGASWYWSFGDSTFSTEQNPTHTYIHNGEYHVCLTITHTNPPCQDSKCLVVHIGPPPPPPCSSWFSHLPNWLNVSFEGHMSMNIPATYSWDFGDGTTGSGKNVDHHFAGPGFYPVSLTTVTLDSNQCTWTSTQQIHVGDSTNIHPIYGQVFAGNFPLEHGLVMLFSVDTGANSPPPFFGQCFIDSAGVYFFPYVPNGEFVIWALPFDSVGGYLPTFYGDVIFWEQATRIILGNPQNPYNIHLVHTTHHSSGPGGINGQINSALLKSTTVDKITMLLLDEQMQPIGYQRVNADGSFDFSTLDYGTYYLKPELPGCPGDLVKVVISASTPVASVTLTYTGNGVLGINDPVDVVESLIIYPNPVTDLVNIVLNVTRDDASTVTVYSLGGQVVTENTFNLVKGANKVTLDLSAFKPGMYTLRISSVNGISQSRKLILTR